MDVRISPSASSYTGSFNRKMLLYHSLKIVDTFMLKLEGDLAACLQYSANVAQ